MYTRIVQHSIKTNYKLILTRQHEWRVDYPWFLRRIEGHDILDLGFMAHAFFTRALCEYGFGVTGVDFNSPSPDEWRFDPGTFRFVRAGVQDIPVPPDAFDTVVAPSLLEHVGLGFYGDRPDERGWESALREWRRVLRPGGLLLVQVPYGSRARVVAFQGKPYYRIYMARMLLEQFLQYETCEVSYRSLEPHGWIEVSRSVADHIDHTAPFPPCIARIAARKPSV